MATSEFDKKIDRCDSTVKINNGLISRPWSNVQKTAIGAIGVLAAASLFAGVAPAQAATSKTLRDTGTAGCVSGITQYGAYPELAIYDDMTLNSGTSFHITASNAKGYVYDCGPAGHQVSGGSFTLSNSWRVTGIKMSSCTIAGGGGCGVSGGKVASASYKKSGTNTGTTSYSGGGWNVYAGTAGALTQYQHSATYRLSSGNDTSDAASSNVWNF